MATYRDIADDLRRRIDDGVLPPGARVPSTRALARTWKVAVATAARALREIAHSGHVRAAPRSGNVVAGRVPPVSGELSRARIVAAAIRIADREGIEALSIRGVAAQLEAPVMSLYRHVRSKDELLDAMADAAIGEHVLPAVPPGGWRAQLELAAREEWRMMRRHPWAARLMHVSRPSLSPNALAFVEWVMRALADTPLSSSDKLRLHVLLHGFIQGLAVNLEAEARAVGDSGITDAEYMRAREHELAAVAATGRHPHFAAMTRGIPASFELDLDDLFEHGLKALLDGFAPHLDGRAGAPRRRTRRG